jgi:2-polyprenyl-3-methyl-5-hydroxy-6-metoxy-1,4-benzoquinol methylase
MTVSADSDIAATEEEQAGALAEQLFGAALGVLELATTQLGLELGLYDALADGGPATSAELAARAGIAERYAREWLEQQAAARIVDVDDPGKPAPERRFTLPAGHATVLLDQEHPAYSGVLASMVPVIGNVLDQLKEAFRTGGGVPFADYGLHDLQAGFTRPMFAGSLVSEWLPALADVHARLEAGEAVRIADFGCGEGWAGIYIAEAYPNAVVHGYDLDDASIAAARNHASERGVVDRVQFEVQDVTDPAFGERYDLVLAVEMVHDLADPVGALRAMRRLAGGSGAVLVIDENATEAFEGPADEIQRLLYGFSVLHCLPAGMADSPSAETGTVMRPDTFKAYARDAGFGSVEVLPVEHDFFRFYRLDG